MCECSIRGRASLSSFGNGQSENHMYTKSASPHLSRYLQCTLNKLSYHLPISCALFSHAHMHYNEGARTQACLELKRNHKSCFHQTLVLVMGGLLANFQFPLSYFGDHAQMFPGYMGLDLLHQFLHLDLQDYIFLALVTPLIPLLFVPTYESLHLKRTGIFDK